jgi:UDP-glucose 6-dehydrogenase
MKIGVVGHGVVGSAVARFFSVDGQDGVSCDVSAVEECVSWITAPICIRSTIPPGTVDRLAAASEKSIVFSPEYLGEQPGHPWQNEGDSGFLIVGGSAAACELVLSAYRLIFRGRCLPKDISAIVAAMKPFGGAPLLEAIMEYNARLCEVADRTADASALAAGS